MLPNLTALQIHARPTDPDDVLRHELFQLALTLNASSVRNWVISNREFARIAKDPYVWRMVLQQLAQVYPNHSGEIERLLDTYMDARRVWTILATRFQRCGALYCGVALYMKPNIQNGLRDATFVSYLKPVIHNLSSEHGIHPCDERNGCTNTLLWHACIPRDIVYAENIPLAPSNEGTSRWTNNQTFWTGVRRFKRRYVDHVYDQFGPNPPPDVLCDTTFFRNDFVVQADDGTTKVTFNTFPWMSMCREATYKFEPMLGEMSCEPLLYMWEGEVNISAVAEDVLENLRGDIFHDASEDDPISEVVVRRRWWFYVGVLPDEPTPNRMRLRLREFGLWREDEVER